MCTVEHVFSVEKLALARGNTTPGILVRVEVEAWLHVAKDRVQVSHSGGVRVSVFKFRRKVTRRERVNHSFRSSQVQVSITFLR